MENQDALGKENNAGVVYLALESSRKSSSARKLRWDPLKLCV